MSKTKLTARTKWILLAAISAVPVAGWVAPASAQYRNEQRGDALDANRRVGSDRRHDVNSNYRVDNRLESVRPPTGNEIITGNVTGNRQFRANPGYRSEREFRSNTASDESDDFIRRSAGTAGAANRTDYNVSVPFYPAGRTTSPPPGFVPVNALGGGYVPQGTVDNRIDRGAITPRGGTTVLNGPINATDLTGSTITASPLLGVQQNPYGVSSSLYGQDTFGQRQGMLDAGTIERMRNELRTGTSETGTANTPGAAGSGANDAGFDAQGQPLGQPIIRLRQPGDPAGANGEGQQQQDQRQGQQQQQRQQGGAFGGPINNAVGSGAALTGQSTRQRLLPTPDEQTPAYAELRRKLQELAGNNKMTDEEAFRAARRARQEADAAAKKAQPPTETPAPGQTPQQQQQPAADPNAAPQTNAERLGLQDFSNRNEQLLRGDAKADAAQRPGGGAGAAPEAPRGTGGVPTAAPQASGAKPAPVKIDSLAKGVPGRGLADLLTGAESLMKEGRFSTALEKYDQAEQVAPNNPLIKLGRANAELGASYFARADQHLREAFAADEALLMGQYDLRAFFGEDRLKVIANDLKEIANKEKNQVRPVFLLAYVAYNSENERMARDYLDLAEQRAGGKDPVIKKMREHWTLPAAEEAAPAEPAAEAVEQPKPTK